MELQADTLYFEFCLHELSDHDAAIAKAKTLAPDIVIFDHTPGSNWAYVGDEDKKVQALWQAMKHWPQKRFCEFETIQKFADYNELLAKVKSQGEVAIQRIAQWQGQRDIHIPMTYGLALLKTDAHWSQEARAIRSR